MEKANAERKLSVEKAKVDIVTLKRRDEDLDTLFKRIYEDMVSGRLSAERFDKLSSEYETEQKNVRKYTDPEELTAEILNDLVDQIVVHAPDKSSGHRMQDVNISLACIGFLSKSILSEMVNHAAKSRTA